MSGLVTGRSGLGSTPCAFLPSASHSLTLLPKRYGYRFIIDTAILFVFPPNFVVMVNYSEHKIYQFIHFKFIVQCIKYIHNVVQPTPPTSP